MDIGAFVHAMNANMNPWIVIGIIAAMLALLCEYWRRDGLYWRRKQNLREINESNSYIESLFEKSGCGQNIFGYGDWQNLPYALPKLEKEEPIVFCWDLINGMERAMEIDPDFPPKSRIQTNFFFVLPYETSLEEIISLCEGICPSEVKTDARGIEIFNARVPKGWHSFSVAGIRKIAAGKDIIARAKNDTDDNIPVVLSGLMLYCAKNRKQMFVGSLDLKDQKHAVKVHSGNNAITVKEDIASFTFTKALQ